MRNLSIRASTLFFLFLNHVCLTFLSRSNHLSLALFFFFFFVDVADAQVVAG